MSQKKSTINNDHNNDNDNNDKENNDNKIKSSPVPVSSVPIRCCRDYTGAGKCTVGGEDIKEDKTREEADMTLSLVFPKSSKVVQKCPREVQIHI